MRALLLMVFMFSLSCWAQSIPPAQTRAKASEVKQYSTSNCQQASPANNPGTDNNPVVVKVLPALYDSKEAEAIRKEREAKAAVDTDLVRLTGDLAAYTKQLAVFTAVLAFIATLQLLVFAYQGWQLKRTVESAENIERPYLVQAFDMAGIFPPHHAINVWPDQNYAYIPGVNYGIKNCGKTPAIITQQYVDIVILEALPANPPYAPPIIYGDGIVAAGDEMGPSFIPVGDGNTVTTITTEDWKAFAEQKKFFLFFGYVKYESIFGKKHETRFGYRFQIENAYSTFNEVGGDAYNKRT